MRSYCFLSTLAVLRGILIILFVFSTRGFSNPVTSDPQNLQRIRDGFRQTQSDQIYYHWTSYETGMRWVEQGRLDQGEVDFYNRPTGTRQSYGAGIYLAASPTSSKQFGKFPVAFVVPKGTLIYDEKIVQEVVGRSLKVDEIAELGKQIPFIRNVANDWWLTHNSAVTSRIEYAGLHGAHAQAPTDLREISKFLDSFKKAGDNGQYLESFFHLLFYSDGISILRTLSMPGTNPWSQFEPEHFETFRVMNREFLNQISPANPQTTLWGAQEESRDKWARQMVSQEIPSLFQRLYSTPHKAFRGRSVRAGGTGPGATFQASPQQLAILLNNPYLSVDYLPNSTGSGFDVSYHYPDIRHLAKVRPLLSPRVVEELSRHSKQQIDSDPELESRLNQILLDDLMISLFRDIHRTTIDPVDFMNRYISIHPFGDGNGRTCRMFLQKHLGEVGRALPPMFVSDLDILVSKKTLEDILTSSTQAYTKLAQALVQELLNAHFGSRAARFHDVPEFSELITSLETFGFTREDSGKIVPRFNSAIYERKFNEVFTQMHGAAWSLVPDQSLVEGVSLAVRFNLKVYLDAVEGRISKSIQLLSQEEELAAQSTFLSGIFLLNLPLPNIKRLESEYIRKLSSVLRTLNYKSEDQIQVLQTYMDLVAPSQQRAILAAIIRNAERNGTMASARIEQFKKRHFEMAFKAIVKKVVDGRVDASLLGDALRSISIRTLPLETLGLNEHSVTKILERMSPEEQVELLMRLNLIRMPITTERLVLLESAARTLTSARSDHADRARQVLTQQLINMIRDMTSTHQSTPARGLLQLLLKLDAQNRFLLDRYFAASPIILETMQDVLEQVSSGGESLNKSNLDALWSYLKRLLSSSTPLRFDNASMARLMNMFDAQPVMSLIPYLQVKDFKGPIYNAFLKWRAADRSSNGSATTELNIRTRVFEVLVSKGLMEIKDSASVAFVDSTLKEMGFYLPVGARLKVLAAAQELSLRGLVRENSRIQGGIIELIVASLREGIPVDPETISRLLLTFRTKMNLGVFAGIGREANHLQFFESDLGLALLKEIGTWSSGTNRAKAFEQLAQNLGQGILSAMKAGRSISELKRAVDSLFTRMPADTLTQAKSAFEMTLMADISSQTPTLVRRQTQIRDYVRAFSNANCAALFADKGA